MCDVAVGDGSVVFRRWAYADEATKRPFGAFRRVLHGRATWCDLHLRRSRSSSESAYEAERAARDKELVVLNIRAMLPEGVHHWTATHPEWEGPVSAYAIDDGERLILIDPIDVPDDVRALFGSREVVTVLTSTWHERDAASLGFPVWAPAPDRPEDQLVSAIRRGGPH